MTTIARHLAGEMEPPGPDANISDTCVEFASDSVSIFGTSSWPWEVKVSGVVFGPARASAGCAGCVVWVAILRKLAGKYVPTTIEIIIFGM